VGNRVLLVALTLLLAAATERAPTTSAADPPIAFHCALDATCPQIVIAGDPPATLGAGPAPFRGYGDPSLEYDPSTETVWLSYSWLDMLVSDPGPPPVIDFGVRTHLAQSNDGGATFSFVRAVSETEPITHPDSAAGGWTIHEVSTLVREAPGAWQTLWLTYFDPFGPPPQGTDHRSDFYYTRSLSTTPGGAGDVATPWIRGTSTSPSFGAVHNLSTIPQLSDCVAFTEPALFAHGGATYLASNCVVFAGGIRRDDLERLVLLRRETNGYSYVGALIDYADALDLGATRLEQADLTLSRDGRVLLIATPIVSGGNPEHLGCVVFEVSDIAAAQVLRDGNGDAVQLARFTGDDTSSVGPGACTYDPASASGLLLVSHTFTANPFDLEFKLRATGIHPGTADADADGLVDSVETPCGSDPLAAASVPERIDGPFAGVDDDGDAQTDEPLPPGASSYDCDGDGYIGAGEDHVYSNLGPRDQDACGNDGWPADLVSTGPSANRITLTDLSSFIAPLPRKLNTDPGDPGYDVRWDLVTGNGGAPPKDIALTDISNITLLKPPMLGGNVRAFSGPVCPWPP